MRQATLYDKETNKSEDAIEIFGTRIDAVADKDALRSLLKRDLLGKTTRTLITPNPEILLRARGDATFQEILNGADHSVADGVGITFISLLKKRIKVRRIPGVEIGEMLIELAFSEGVPMLFLGGRNGSAISAAKRFTKQRTDSKLYAAGDNAEITEAGDVPDPAEEKRIYDAIRQMRPKIILVGLGAPKQERWIARHKDQFPGVRIMASVGGSFDIWSGRYLRAPRLIRKLGLEWSWRLALEPSRLPRIFKAVIVFPFYAFTERTKNE